jgi:hypothetical protein
MEIVRSVVLPGPAATVFEFVDDLGRYPEWMELVHDVTELDPDLAGHRAWEVELRAHVGPLARSKRLRMVRSSHAPPTRVVFERSELDGRHHSPWVLHTDVRDTDVRDTDLAPSLDGTSAPAGSVELTMRLTYGGSLWTGAVLQRVLDDHVERGAAALVALRRSGGR